MNTQDSIDGINKPKAKAIYTGLVSLDKTHRHMKAGGEPLEVVAKTIIARERLREEYLREIDSDVWPR